LEPRSVWRKTKATGPEILSVVLDQWGYEVSCCKLTTKHLTPEVEAYLVAKKTRIVHVWRENVLRTAVSAILHSRYRRGKLKVSMEHTLTPPNEYAKVTISPGHLIGQCQRVVQLQRRLRQEIDKMALPFFSLTYVQITKDAPNFVNPALCDFLGVSNVKMTATLQRLNPLPLSEMLLNWTEVEDAVRNSIFAEWLDRDG